VGPGYGRAMIAAALRGEAPDAPEHRRWAAPASRPTGEVIRVFDHEPDLLAGVPRQDVDALRCRALARRVSLEPGPWTPPSGPAERFRESLGLLVLDGLMTRSLAVEGRDCPELVGAGDVLRPWDGAEDLSSVEHAASWRVLTATSLAVLDARFARAVCTAPSVMSSLLSRSVARSRTLAFHLAIAHVRHADVRILLLLWHLADRWGRVTPDGTVLPLPVTHELLAHLVCMRRPTASTALQQLKREGRIARHPGGGWLLLGPPPVLNAAADGEAAKPSATSSPA
jgi:CRP/FNR family cyclic AMP-dependent transcriptional regulator